MIKNFLLLFPLLFSSVTYSQSICDSVYVTPEIVYINQLKDTTAYIEFTFTGESDISYSAIWFEFPDSSNIDINQMAITNGISGPFTYSYNYTVIYNNLNIPPNTIVNALVRVYHGGIPEPTIDCTLPLTFIVNSTTGITNSNTTNNNFKFNIFPNPANNFLFFESDVSNYELSIYDLSGRRVLNRTLTNASSFIDISKLSEGIYILVMKNNNAIGNNALLTRKIVKLK